MASVLDLPLVAVTRFETGGIAVAVGVWGLQTPYPVGTSWRLDEHGASGRVYHSGRSSRADYAQVPGPIVATLSSQVGIRSAVAVPIIVSNRTWGAMMALATVTQPADTEARLASFTDLVATAIANADAREELKLLAAEQAALRRVATLVAGGAEPRTIFDAVCEETGRLIGAAIVNLTQFNPDGTNVPLAGWSLHGNHVPPGTRLPMDKQSVAAQVQRTRAPARVHSYQGMPGRLAARMRELGIRSGVGAPVIVDGSVWGALIVTTASPQPLPAGTEPRLARFADLIGTAVSNATARVELIASRARLVTASDAASTAWVRVVVEDDRCTIEVRDDGIGGAEARLETSGLIGLRDRMGALKGAMHISSPASSGTTLRAWLPLPRTLLASEAEGTR